MMNVLFIHKDSRVDVLVVSLRQISRVAVHAVGGFDQGMQEVFEKRPDMIFIQEEIDGVSCIAVAGHIKSLLRENAPRIFMLRVDPGKKLLAGRDFFDDTIDLTGFADDLLVDVCQRMDAVSAKWRQELPQEAEEIGLAAEALAVGEVERIAEELRASAETEMMLPEAVPVVPFVIDDRVTESQFDFERAVALSNPAPAQAAALALAESEASPVPVAEVIEPQSHQQPAPVDPPLATSPHKEPWHAEQLKAEPESVDEELLSFEEVFANRRQNQSRAWLYLLCLVGSILLAVGSYYLFFAVSTQSAKPPAAPVSPLPATVLPVSPSTAPALQVAPVKLPPSLAAAELDAAYGERRPGWERRVTKGFEVLVFREQGAVRAVQLIASGVEGLSAKLVEEFFTLAGGTKVDWRSEKNKSGFRVEQGVLPNRAEVLRYSRPGTRTPAALVVALP